MSAILYLRNVSSGEIHRLYQDAGGRYSREKCNLDDAVKCIEVAEDEALKAPADDKCGHCWPEEVTA